MIRNYLGRITFKLFLWSAGKFFPKIWVYSTERVEAMFFSVNNRSMNTAARTYVEQLDDEGHSETD